VPSPHWITATRSDVTGSLSSKAPTSTATAGLTDAYDASAFTADRNRTGGAMRVSIAKQLEGALRLVASLVSHPRLSTATVV